MGTSIGPELHVQLDRMTRRLAGEFAGVFSQETIARYVEESAEIALAWRGRPAVHPDPR